MKTATEQLEDTGMTDFESCLAQMEASRHWFVARVLSLSDEQLQFQPLSGGWSIAHCIDHLNIAINLYLPKLEEAIGRGWGQGKRYRSGLLCTPEEQRVLTLVEPPVMRPVSAPPILEPAAIDTGRLSEQFYTLRDSYAGAVRRAYGLDGSGIELPGAIHPVIRSLGGTLLLIAAHDRRHMWQAEQVRKTPEFALISTSNFALATSLS
ncbi:MAG: DinB family protein [Bryobacteraceae bacterium]|nr:DinB family protein [Bryobacteraceae bacterium]